MELPMKYLASMKEQLSEKDFQAYLESFSEETKRGIRFNPLKVSGEDQERILKKIGQTNAKPVPWSGGYGFYDTMSASPARHPFYYAGLYYIQEPSAMAPAALLPIEEGDKVLDLCAAPGGKSTLLGARLKGNGLLVANDISASRAKALLKNIEMAGIANALVSSENPEKLKKVFPEFFDKILIDAPCSGEGMFRREPSMVKSWENAGPEYYSEIQKELLLAACEMLKPGGMLLYSTCTFSPVEDEENIAFILNERPDMKGVSLPEFEGFTYNEEKTYAKLYPWKIEGEGHFAALLKKDGEALTVSDGMSDAAKSNRTFLKKYPAIEQFLSLWSGYEAGKGYLWEKNGQVYMLPMEKERLGNVRYLRTGLLLGELKKDRFEPAQSLAMAMKSTDFQNVVDYEADDEAVIRYLKGETVMTDHAEVKGKDGWCLVCASGYPLGFAKRKNNQLKNKYYPGWRWQ